MVLLFNYVLQTYFSFRCWTEQPISAKSGQGWVDPPYRCKHKASFKQSYSKVIWGHLVFHPNHRIYLPSSEGQSVRGHGVFLEKVRGPVCVFACICLLEGWRVGLEKHGNCGTLGSLWLKVDDPKRKMSQRKSAHPKKTAQNLSLEGRR